MDGPSILVDEKTRKQMMLNATKLTLGGGTGMGSRGSVRPATGAGQLLPPRNQAARRLRTYRRGRTSHQSEPLLTGSSLAITAAAEDQGWRVIGEAPGVVTAILVRRTHEAVVTIGYDELNFWIDYKDSKNLNYNPKDLMKTKERRANTVTKGPRIHPNYNRWVAELADQITLQMQNPPERQAEPT